MNEMLEICNRYEIDVIDKNHPEYYKDEDFSMADIMKEPNEIFLVGIKYAD